MKNEWGIKQTSDKGKKNLLYYDETFPMGMVSPRMTPPPPAGSESSLNCLMRTEMM